MEMKKTKIKINVPIYKGFTILDVSKRAMWELFYDYLKTTYGDKVKLCYTDTDSLLFILKQKTFTKTLITMLKNSLILQIIRFDRY